jgi:hypothetical protein
MDDTWSLSTSSVRWLESDLLWRAEVEAPQCR